MIGREKRKTRAVLPKGYTQAVLLDPSGLQDPGKEILRREATSKHDKVNAYALQTNQDADSTKGGQHDATKVEKSNLKDPNEEILAQVALRTTYKRYSEQDFEVSLMPKAIDLLMEERRLITHTPRSVLPEMLVGERDYEDWALTKPSVQVETQYGRYTVVPRGRLEMKDEEGHRRNVRTRWQKLKGVPVKLADPFQIVRLEQGARPFRRSSARLLYKKRRFASLDLETIAPVLESCYRTLPDTLENIVSERLSPLCRLHLPKLWKLVGMRIACLISLGIAPALLYFVLGWTPLNVSSGRLIDIGILAGLVFVTLIPIRQYRRRRARYIKGCWQAFKLKLDSEITRVNAEISTLEQPHAPGNISIKPVYVWLGHDPYTSDRIAQVVEAMQESDRFNKAKAILAEQEAKIAELQKKREELEQQGKTADTEVIELFGKEKVLVKEVKKQRKAVAKFSQKRMMLAQKSKIPKGSYLVVHRLTIDVELPGILNPLDNLVAKRAPYFSESEAENASINQHIPRDLRNACIRCQQITQYTQGVGLESIAENLCKSAREDAVAFDEYRLRKLLKLDPDADLKKVFGKKSDGQGDDKDLTTDESTNKDGEDLADKQSQELKCCICQGPRYPH